MTGMSAWIQYDWPLRTLLHVAQVQMSPGLKMLALDIP